MSRAARIWLLVVLAACGGGKRQEASTSTVQATTTGAGGAAATTTHAGGHGGESTSTTTHAGGATAGTGGQGGAGGATETGPCAKNGGCAEHATCTPADGGRTCACDEGFVGDGLECTPKALRVGIGTWNHVTGDWRLRDASAGAAADVTFNYGGPNFPTSFLPLMGDWDGDGVATPGLFDAATSTFLLRYGLGGGDPDVNLAWGGARALPLVGDWHELGHAGIGVYRPYSGVTIWSDSAAAPNIDGEADLTWLGMFPVVGDWDGDGAIDLGVYNQQNGRFRLWKGLVAPAAPAATFDFGTPLSIPVVGDWDGDGKDTVGFFDPTTREWQLRNSNSAGPPDHRFVFGAPGALPVVWKKKAK